MAGAHRRGEIAAPTHPMNGRQHGARSGGELLAALATAAGEDGAARTGTHTQTEAVGLGAAPVVRLERALAHRGSQGSAYPLARAPERTAGQVLVTQSRMVLAPTAPIPRGADSQRNRQHHGAPRIQRAYGTGRIFEGQTRVPLDVATRPPERCGAGNRLVSAPAPRGQGRHAEPRESTASDLVENLDPRGRPRVGSHASGLPSPIRCRRFPPSLVTPFTACG
jgi:hypothetical protein